MAESSRARQRAVGVRGWAGGGHGGASAARWEETEMVGPDEIQKGCAEPKMHREGHGMPIQIEKKGK